MCVCVMWESDCAQFLNSLGLMLSALDGSIVDRMSLMSCDRKRYFADVRSRRGESNVWGMVKLEFVYNEKKYWLKQLEMPESEITVLIPSVINY